ncbi:hypothetical protein CGRA01v4_05044 [Colletotrichum graminicola]|nr:hypothetical protein CGRA01v4_05044 [Colletotrichum graminicola]
MCWSTYNVAIDPCATLVVCLPGLFDNGDIRHDIDLAIEEAAAGRSVVPTDLLSRSGVVTQHVHVCPLPMVSGQLQYGADSPARMLWMLSSYTMRPAFSPRSASAEVPAPKLRLSREEPSITSTPVTRRGSRLARQVPRSAERGCCRWRAKGG